jgi:hypothetical protein
MAYVNFVNISKKKYLPEKNHLKEKEMSSSIWSTKSEGYRKTILDI